MNTLATQFVTIVTLLLVLLIKTDGDSISPIPYEVNKTSITNIVVEVGVDQIDPIDCTNRPGICSNGEFPPRSVCCRNRCVDLTSDINNCGFCGVSCPFNNWHCCNRVCVNTNFSPLNCGGCGNTCPIGRLCLLGTCAFTPPAQPTPEEPAPAQPPPAQPAPKQPPLLPPGFPAQPPLLSPGFSAQPPLLPPGLPAQPPLLPPGFPEQNH